MSKISVKDRAIDGLMTILSGKPWHAITLVCIAHEAGLTLVQLRSVACDKYTLLKLFSARIDDAMLADAQFDDMDASERERLAEVILLRLDSLRPYREALLSLRNASRRDPRLALALARNSECAMRWARAAAGIRVSGLQAVVFSKALVVIYIRIFGLWLSDHSEDMSTTMTELEKRLLQAEKTWFMIFRTRARNEGARGSSTETQHDSEETGQPT